MDLFLIKHKLKHDFPLVPEATCKRTLKRAAVMIMLYPRRIMQTHVLMTRRSMHLKYHAGEISFPGGVFEEDEDDDLLATALRETDEELDIEVDPGDVVGRLLYC